MFIRAATLILCALYFVLTLTNAKVYRLPKIVEPIRYILTIDASISPFYYNGSVIIELKALENSRNITLHEKGIDISFDDINIVDWNGKQIKTNNASKNATTQTYTIFLANKLRKGNYYNLTIGEFSRKYESTGGFFYTVIYNVVRESFVSAAATHFEPSYARSAFPCFDEPALKAKFLISLIRNKRYLSVFNEALVITEILGNGRFKDTFKETPRMPTFIVEFTVSNYKFLKIGKQRIFGTPIAIESGELDKALEVGLKALPTMEEYTGINYTLSKIDQFAIPKFRVPGMENWGLIIYSDDYVRVKNTTNAENLQLMTLTVTHEFSHQWFGNLVTPEWWNYRWLSESFATYFQYIIASTIEPSWRLMDQMVVNQLKRALYKEEFYEAGTLNGALPYNYFNMPITHILYAKGSAIIRMTEHFLTPKVFRNGIHIYLQNNKFSSAVPSDLYSALQIAVDHGKANKLLGNFSVADILTTWDSTKGFPIVTVTRNYTSGALSLTQQASVNGPSRIIPISYVFTRETTKFSKTVADYWLKEVTATINENFPTDGWVIVNIQQTGYYRVNYDLENWERIIGYMNSENYTSIHVLNRAQLIDDAFNMAYNKIIPWHIPLRLSEYLIREKDYIPFATFCDYCKSHMFALYGLSFKDVDKYKNFQKFALEYTTSANSTSEELTKEYINTVLSEIAWYLGPNGRLGETHLNKLTRRTLRFCYE